MRQLRAVYSQILSIAIDKDSKNLTGNLFQSLIILMVKNKLNLFISNSAATYVHHLFSYHCTPQAGEPAPPSVHFPLGFSNLIIQGRKEL